MDFGERAPVLHLRNTFVGDDLKKKILLNFHFGVWMLIFCYTASVDFVLQKCYFLFLFFGLGMK